ncbi:unnamed protein product [Didymodactylos carnosus]|uniref:Uncharacterized protein n=1 Tax=Didymodactylos carnosus TaxID=1234261 RepID=A0A8S2NB13_9BILA|nr:unnamed protein product [Didymodactylos carnosus]CAF3994267.1 unnamed protein product [Didymodactylos carnosus]
MFQAASLEQKQMIYSSTTQINLLAGRHNSLPYYYHPLFQLRPQLAEEGQHLFSSEIQTNNHFNILLERSRASRDTYDERQKLIATYKVVSKTQCMLQMLNDGTVNAKHVKNLEDNEETQWGKNACI